MIFYFLDFYRSEKNQEIPETSYQTSHLVQNICIFVYSYNVLRNFQVYILSHAYGTIDVVLNFKNISQSRINDNTVSWISFFFKATIIGPQSSGQKDYVLFA